MARLIAVFAAVSLCLFSVASRAQSTFTVDSTGDAGAGTLRQAILDSNANPPPAGTRNRIEFDLAGASPFTIAPASALPTVTAPVDIDGTSQPGFVLAPIIVLDGNGAGAGVDGLNITAGDSVVRALVIQRFSDNGIVLETGGGNIVTGCYVGTNAAGNADQGNQDDGILILNSANNTIGGDEAGQGNLVSGNGGAGARGIAIEGAGSTGNQVFGNLIGTDVTGTADLGNNDEGVSIGDDASGNFIGGPNVGQGNLISGNSRGVFIQSSATQNTVQGNKIGTNLAGTAALGGLGNNSNGAVLLQGDDNLIGGSTPGSRNIISGNDADGVFIGGGILGISGNRIQGNYIGLDVTGANAVPNNGRGILNSSGNDNIFGGSGAGEGNVISGNAEEGIAIVSQSAARNVVQGNIIGLDASGTVEVPNGEDGVLIEGGAIGPMFGDEADDNQIGGTAAGARNVISGNQGDGVHIRDDSGNALGTRFNIVEGNFIGTDVTGTLDRGNDGFGVFIEGSNENRIGGTSVEARNVISGNDSFGIFILGPATGNLVQGNFVGVDVSGLLPLGNDSVGVGVENTTGNVIGGATGAGNVISGNGSSGVYLNDGAVGVAVQGNFIGTDLGGVVDLGNAGDGILVGQASTDNRLGGGLAEGNTIKFNGENGVEIQETSAVDNAILSNNIFGNDLLGISLNGGQGNLGQEAPALLEATSSGATLTVTGTLASAPNTTYTIQFFVNSSLDPSGFGEGEFFLGETQIVTDGAGNVDFTAVADIVNSAVDLNAIVDPRVTATVTDPNGNTSEFSNGVSLVIAGTVQFSAAAYQANADAGPAVVTLLRSGGSDGEISVQFSTADGTAFAGLDYTGVVQVVTFADGQTSAEVEIPLLNPDGVFGDRTVLLALSNPSEGIVLGDPEAAILTIVYPAAPAPTLISGGGCQLGAPAPSGGLGLMACLALGAWGLLRLHRRGV